VPSVGHGQRRLRHRWGGRHSAGLGKRLGAEVLQERAALPNDAVLVVKVIWPGHSDLTATETLEAVAEFLRQCP
jgi:hypothetical protein